MPGGIFAMSAGGGQLSTPVRYARGCAARTFTRPNGRADIEENAYVRERVVPAVSRTDYLPMLPRTLGRIIHERRRLMPD
jgi:hypothetical protein